MSTIDRGKAKAHGQEAVRILHSGGYSAADGETTSRADRTVIAMGPTRGLAEFQSALNCTYPRALRIFPSSSSVVGNPNSSEMNYMDTALGKHIIALKRRIEGNLNVGHWEELGLLTGWSKFISGHSRLLRSLSFGDEDYGGNVLSVLRTIAEHEPEQLEVIESFLDDNFPDHATFVSAKPSERKITFAPSVFQIPEGSIESDLVAVMMPFRREFDGVFAAIKEACLVVKMRGVRADDIWESSTFIQDIFSLIYRAQVVVVDFTGKNPNVMYETGIAHTLGKHVVPITQSIDDIPSDMNHHRALKYLGNSEGLVGLTSQLAKRLRYVAPSSESGDDSIPF